MNGVNTVTSARSSTATVLCRAATGRTSGRFAATAYKVPCGRACRSCQGQVDLQRQQDTCLAGDV